MIGPFNFVAGRSVLLALAIGMSDTASAISVRDYGIMPDGATVHAFTLKNGRGIEVTVIELGAILATVKIPDRDGNVADVALGFDTLAGWQSSTAYFGAVVGRYANRIAGGRFTLDGQTYILATNNTPGGIPCHLHGGEVGFNRRVWTGRVIRGIDGEAVELTYVSPDGEEGYPGTLTAKVTYSLTNWNELIAEFRATTDRATVVSLAHHAYWNLTGDPTQKITGHELTLAADAVLPVDAGLIPTGRRTAVEGTAFDFTTAAAIGSRIASLDEQLKYGNGYDHCWVISKASAKSAVATLYEPRSGRMLEIFTDQPAIQFYSGNFLDGSVVGKGGIPYGFRTGLCLETQNFPDSPNHPDFPPTVLRPGQTYRHTMRWRFGFR
jgi:aldose 1-epimerase